MIINDVIRCETIASIGDILGTRNNDKFMKAINDYCELGGGGTRFAQNSSQRVKDHFNLFFERVVEPERRSGYEVAEALGTMRMEGIRYITSVADLESGIPVSMHEAILTYNPVRRLLEAGKIKGFGIKVDDLPPEDCYGRMIDNGTVTDMHAITDDWIDYRFEHHHDDPILTYDELRAIRLTREWMGDFLEKTSYDVTSYPNKIGRLKNKRKKK